MATSLRSLARKFKISKRNIWLNGAPGAGKGTNTDFIMRYRNLTAPPIVGVVY